MSLQNKIPRFQTNRQELSSQASPTDKNKKNVNRKTFRFLCVSQHKNRHIDKQNEDCSNQMGSRLKGNENRGQLGSEKKSIVKKDCTNIETGAFVKYMPENPYNNCLNSNKASQIPQLAIGKTFKGIKEIENSKGIKDILKAKIDDVIASSETRDGQHLMISRALSGDKLTQAVKLELKNYLKSKQNTQSKTSSPRDTIQIDQSKVSTKENGNIKAYAVNTHQGISRNYNEDRVSIILNISKDGVKASFFAIYDGHGGSNCCNYLSENLHQHILGSKHFPSRPRQAIIQGIKFAEHTFIDSVKQKISEDKQLDRSGSCITLALFVGNDCYIANLGDSRAVLSTCRGKPLYSLSRDHKPSDVSEQQRIFKAGGKIYRTEIIQKTQNNTQPKKTTNFPIIGPLRVFPGKLSVTRTIGDIQAKQKSFGGLQNCVSSDPQICKYTLTGKQDFIILGCDGIFEKMDSGDVVKCAWQELKKNETDLHEACGRAAEQIIRESMLRQSTDNVTAILIHLGQPSLMTLPRYQSI